MDFPAKIILSICFRLEADRKIAEHQIHELQARLDEVEANALKNGKKAAAKLETRFDCLTNLNFAYLFNFPANTLIHFLVQNLA